MAKSWGWFQPFRLNSLVVLSSLMSSRPHGFQPVRAGPLHRQQQRRVAPEVPSIHLAALQNESLAGSVRKGRGTAVFLDVFLNVFGFHFVGGNVLNPTFWD